MAPVDEYAPDVAVGSTDWAGGTAPAGGTHTGVSVLTMVDGASFLVAHSFAEVEQKRQAAPVAPENPFWVAFDQPGVAVPVILDVGRIQSVGSPTSSSPPSFPDVWDTNRLWGTFLWGA